MNINDWTKQLKELDELDTKARCLYSTLLYDCGNSEDIRKACNKAFLLCDAIQSNRFACQTHIIQHQMGNTNDGSDYDEPIWSSADDQSDEMDALGSIGWAEDEYY